MSRIVLNRGAVAFFKTICDLKAIPLFITLMQLNLFYREADIFNFYLFIFLSFCKALLYFTLLVV